MTFKTDKIYDEGQEIPVHPKLIRLMLFGRCSSRGSHSHGSLECIIDPPLETSQSADHDNTSTETAPDAAETELAENLAGRLATLGHLGDDGVCRVGNNGTNYTSSVTRGEGDTELGRLRVGLLRGSEDVFVEHLDDFFEEEKLGHCVRDLSGPQRNERAKRELRGRIRSHLGEGRK